MPVIDSIARATSTSGAAVLVAGGTVVIAILGLYVSGVPFVGALGLSSALVVAVTIVSALTLVPALLALLLLDGPSAAPPFPSPPPSPTN